MAQVPENKSIQQVDIKEVFKSKNPKLAQLIPGFIFRYLKRILRQDEVNYMLRTYGHLYDLEYADACIKEFEVTIRTEGLEKIDTAKKYIFVANHPLGGFDGIVLMKVVGEKLGKLKFLVNDILMNVTNFRGLFIPINKHGKQAIQAVKQIEEAYESDAQILTFPAGLVSRKIKGRIIDLEWQKSFVLKSVKHQRDVIPVHFSGKNSKFFYRLGSIRKKLGIKANLEMLYLVDETFNHRNKTVTLKFGDPIPWQTFDKSRRPKEWAKWVKEKLYALDGVTNVPV